MAMSRQTLPRHTNLASQGLRTVAAIVDFAIFFAVMLGLYFGAFRFAFSNKTNQYRDQLYQYQIDSHLLLKGEDGYPVLISSKDSKDYQDAIEGFYLRYLANNPLEGEVAAPYSDQPLDVDGKEILPKDLYTIEYFNKNVLNITQDNPDGEMSESYFTFQKDSEGNYLRNEPAIRRSVRYDADDKRKVDLTEEDFLYFYKVAYKDAYVALVMQDFYRNIADLQYFYTTVALVTSAVLSGIIFYIVIPWILKNGQTLGKKIFKLGLATYDGYLMSNWQLLLRFVPFLLIVLSQLIPVIFSNMLYVILLFVAVLMVSFALAMASPKKAALHDFAARTIVVDLASSIIFENEIMEEDYIAREDNIVVENNGEEPELRYER